MKRLLLALVPLLVLAALVGLFWTNIDRDPDLIPSVMINKPVPDFALAPVEDFPMEGFASTDLTGKARLVNVFASWCVPCRDEHPILMDLAANGVEIYGINQKDTPINARAFLNGLGNPYTRIGADRNGRVSIDWGVYGVPETFVVNAKGVITYKHTGPISEWSLKESLLPALEAAQAQ